MAGSETHHTLTPPVFTDEKPNLAIVVSPYYKDIADNLVAGAQSAITASGATFEMVEVPGALEIPTAIRIAGRPIILTALSRLAVSFEAKPRITKQSATTAAARCNCSGLKATASATAS